MEKVMTHRILILILGLLLNWVVSGCNFSPNGPEQISLDLTQPWISVRPVEAGFDSDGLSKAVVKASQIPRFLSLIVVRDGRLVLEEYFHGNHADSLNDVRSVTKSVISTLIGVALHEGFIGSLDETLGDYLHPDVEVLDPSVQAISIRDLLSMTGGFLWEEIGGDSYNTWIRSEDHIRHVLNQPLVNNPGASFTYNSGAVHLLGVLLQEAVKMPLPVFAEQYFFRKIGIQRSRWEALTRGYVNGGSGIDIRPRDLARLGQFYLQGGASGDTQILPVDWVEEATRPRFEWRSTYGPLRELTYAYLWWVEEGQASHAFFAWGFGGQYIYVVPD